MGKSMIHFRIFGKHIYISDCHLRKKYAKRSNSKELRNIIKSGGVVLCELCGEETTTPTVHHAYECSTYPQYRRANWNKMVLCPNCHAKAHLDEIINTELKSIAWRRKSESEDQQSANASA